MKRSKILQIIEDTIEQSCGADENGILYPDDKYLAFRILKVIEENGMLPPIGSRIEQVDIIDKWGIDTGKKEMARVIKPLWDEE